MNEHPLGMISTSNSEAAKAGAAMLRAGGNAIDAAIAAAIALCVAEPVSTGIGDLMAIVWDGQTLHGLNACGRLPLGWHASRMTGPRMPMLGWDSVVVPGAASGWQALSAKFGARPFEDLFMPAIALAQDGFSLSPVTASKWAKRAPGHASQPGFRELFMPSGKAPKAGETWRNPALAKTLASIAVSNAESFYQGDLAAQIARLSEAQGGSLRANDLARHKVEWVDPLSQRYRDAVIHQLPAPCQGIVTLVALGILGHFDLKAGDEHRARNAHLQIEALKTAFELCYRHLADDDVMRDRSASWLEPACLARYAEAIKEDKAGSGPFYPPPWGGTVQVCTADRQGRMVSLIQSNFDAFGSGVVIPSLGLHLNNRAACFSLAGDHPNFAKAGQRPFNTIMPGFATRDGLPWLALGVTGGPIQPQGQVQLLSHMLDGQATAQRAVDAPRWKIEHNKQTVQVDFEAGYDPETLASLRGLGHLEGPPGITGLDFGGGFAIRHEAGQFEGGADPRRDKGLLKVFPAGC